MPCLVSISFIFFYMAREDSSRVVMSTRDNRRSAINELFSLASLTFRMVCPCLRNLSGFLALIFFPMTKISCSTPHLTWLMSAPGPLLKLYPPPRMTHFYLPVILPHVKANFKSFLLPWGAFFRCRPTEASARSLHSTSRR